MIELVDGYYILVDDYSYALVKERGSIDKRTGKKQLYHLGYYGTVEKALQALAKELARNKLKGASVGITEAVNAIRESNQTVEKLLENLT